jgi:hypothetical protein
MSTWYRRAVTRSWIVDLLGAASFERLARELTGAELTSVLLEVMQHRAAARSPADVFAQYQRDPLCRPAAVDPRISVAIDGHLLAAAAGFEAIELSPVAPLAACSSVGPTHQHRALSALRSTEIVGDPTNVLALECAARLRAGPGPIHLATSQRVIRAQPVPRLPGYAPHFRIFALASGGVEASDHAFTAAAVELHIRTMLAALTRLEAHGYAFGARRVELLATAARRALAERIAAALPGVSVDRGPLDHPYYRGGLRFRIWVTPPEGAAFPLIDGGAFDWLASLIANRRAVYVASGIGSQLIALRFRVA